MTYTKSTYEILAWRTLDRGIDDKWVDWAIEMLSSGFETEHLIILAGELKPYNQFYLKELTSKVFKELGLDTSDDDVIMENYILYLVGEAQSGRRDAFSVLDILKNIYFQRDCQASLIDFSLLFWAWEDLQHAEVQFYWPGADRGNISSVSSHFFEDWLINHKYRPL